MFVGAVYQEPVTTAVLVLEPPENSFGLRGFGSNSEWCTLCRKPSTQAANPSVQGKQRRLRYK